MKTVIAYYSLTGTTGKLAERLSVLPGCDMIKIPMFGKIKLPDKYDLVLVGTPIWFYAPSFPAGRLLSQIKDGPAKVAFFCTYQTTIGKSFEKMEAKCGKKPSGVLQLMGTEIGTPVGEEKIRKFLDDIQK
jgi:flavodoxin